MAKKRQFLTTSIKQCEEEDIRKSKNLEYYDNWMWSKRHRSHEVVLTDTYRKGMTTCVTFVLSVHNTFSIQAFMDRVFMNRVIIMNIVFTKTERSV